MVTPVCCSCSNCTVKCISETYQDTRSCVLAITRRVGQCTPSYPVSAERTCDRCPLLFLGLEKANQLYSPKLVVSDEVACAWGTVKRKYGVTCMHPSKVTWVLFCVCSYLTSAPVRFSGLGHRFKGAMDISRCAFLWSGHGTHAIVRPEALNTFIRVLSCPEWPIHGGNSARP